MAETPEFRISLTEAIILIVSLCILLVSLFYLFSLARVPDYAGIFFDPETWKVLKADECPDSANCPRVGDRILSMGELSLEDYRSNWHEYLYRDRRSDGSIQVTFERDGERLQAILQDSPRDLVSLLSYCVIPVVFWVVGTIVVLLVRPRSIAWLTLSLLFFSTSVWIASGLVSSFHVAGSMYVYHAIIWFFLPLLVHVHLQVPYPILRRATRWLMPALYGIAVVMLALDFTGRLNQRVAVMWVSVAALASFALIVFRIVRSSSPTARMADRILLYGVVVGLLPVVWLGVVPLLAEGESQQVLLVIARYLLVVILPIWPLSYLYALHKYSSGPIKLRANRLLGAYGFFGLLVTAFVGLFGVLDLWFPSVGEAPIALLLALAFIVVATPLKRQFQRFIDRTIYGIKYLPQEIISVFAARIPRAFNIDNLRRVLLDEVTPTLMIRESALYVWNDEGDVEEVYREGDPVPPPPVYAESIEGWIRSSTPSFDQETVPSWARFAVPLQGRERTLGVWLLGRRDPDDLYPRADRELLHSIANQVAPVVENIRLVQRAQREVAENQRLQQQLIQSQKMEAIGRLSAGVAHDFNNLLSVILGYSSLLLVKYKGDEALTGYLDDIRDAGDRAAALTRQLLAFSRQQVMEARTVHLNHVVSDVERMLQRLAGEDVEVRTVLGEDLPKVRIDPAQMGQVVMNLAVNARDAMPDGGVFELSTRWETLDEVVVDPIQGEIPAGDYVVLSVSDTGVGMAEDQLQRIFEPYFTTKELGKGTGLGLSMVYGIVSQFDGHIRVDSEPGRGTRFSIYLPVDTADESAVGIRSPLQNDDSLRGSESILVVEDEDSVRHVACEILQAQGYSVTQASDGTEALDLYDDMDDPPDLLLTDVVMPQMKGTDLAVLLTRKQPDLRVLFMSGYNEESVFSGWKGNRDRPALLAKPFSPSTLLAEIRSLLDTGTGTETESS